jgi:4-amino-4-deoxy-L-arabinose transferase-like glycosyltransferase
LCLALASSIILISGLIGGSLTSWDEAIYAEVAREMIKSHDWLTLHYAGAPFLEKPPLVIWLVALTYSALGISEFTSRIVPAVFGVATIVLVAHVGSRLYDKRTGLMAGVILLLGTVQFPITYVQTRLANFVQTFAWMSRLLMLDVPLTFFSLLTIWCFWESLKRPRFLIVAGIAAGFGFMVKGPAIIPVVGVVFLFAAVTHRLRTFLKSKFFTISMGAFLLVALPWHILQIVLYGQEFLGVYLGYQTILRAVTVLEQNTGSPPYYLGVLLGVFGIWSLPSATGFIAVLWDYLKRRTEQGLLLISWIAMPLIVFTVAQTKLPWYVVPIYPAVAILAGKTLGDFSRLRGNLALFGGLLTVVAFLVSFPNAVASAAVFLLLLSYLGIRGGKHLPVRFQLTWWLIDVKRIISIALVAVILLSGLHTFSAPDRSPDSKAVSVFAKNGVPRAIPIFVYQVAAPAVRFYSGHPVVVICEEESPENCDIRQLMFALETQPGAFFITRAACNTLPYPANLTIVFQSNDTKLLENVPGTCHSVP